jgi:hypothetical protein
MKSSQIANTIEPVNARKLQLNMFSRTNDRQSLILSKTVDVSFSTQEFDVEQTMEDMSPIGSIVPDQPAIIHRFNNRNKRHERKSKTIQPMHRINERTTVKHERNKPFKQIRARSFVPRNAVPFISATVDQQIEVQHDVSIKHSNKRSGTTRP